jgi:hypothetical protein
MQLFDGILTTVLLGACVGFCLVTFGSKRRLPQSPSSLTSPSITQSGVGGDQLPIHLNEHGRLLTLSAQELWAYTGQTGRTRKICDLTDFSTEAMDADVWPLLIKFSEFVQLLPASESHHHAQPGGLLIHLLECAELAL